MKKLILLIPLCTMLQLLNAQTVKPTILNSSGITHSSSKILLTYSVGEFSIAVFSKPGSSSIQSGFLHGNKKQNNLQKTKDSIGLAVKRQTPLLLTVYPNPALNMVTIEFNGVNAGKYILQVTDVTGKVLLKKESIALIGNNIVELDVSHYATGMYFISVTNEKGKQIVKLEKG